MSALLKKRTVRNWSSVSADAFARTYRVSAERAIMEGVLPSMSHAATGRSVSLVDFGCGDGRMAKTYVENCEYDVASIRCIDVNPSFLERARDELEGWNVRLDLVTESGPFASPGLVESLGGAMESSAPVVLLLWNVLHHLSDEVIVALRDFIGHRVAKGRELEVVVSVWAARPGSADALVSALDAVELPVGDVTVGARWINGDTLLGVELPHLVVRRLSSLEVSSYYRGAPSVARIVGVWSNVARGADGVR